MAAYEQLAPGPHGCTGTELHSRHNYAVAKPESLDRRRIAARPNPVRPININVHDVGSGEVRADAPSGAKATPRIESPEGAA